MVKLTASEARANLSDLIEETVRSREPIVITSEEGNAVLVAERDWNAAMETLHLLSVPGMRESVREGLEADPANLSETLWH